MDKDKEANTVGKIKHKLGRIRRIMDIKISYLKCKKCGHEWIPRKARVFVCPKCHTPDWKEEK